MKFAAKMVCIKDTPRARASFLKYRRSFTPREFLKAGYSLLRPGINDITVESEVVNVGWKI